jgi:hypothetical protein
MKIVTSFSPTRTEAQQRALSTWKKFGVDIVAVQCKGERYAKQFTDNIVWVEPSSHWSKSTPRIIDLIGVDGPILIVNSDIELNETDLSRWEPEKNKLKIGIRTDYCPDFIQLNKYGIDVFAIHPNNKPLYDNPLWALGVPGWDYWVVMKAALDEQDVIIYKDQIDHEAHKEQWSHADYKKCGHLLEFEFQVPIQDVADKIQNLTCRNHLRKRVVV